MTTSNKITISIRKAVSVDLALRQLASRFFDKIEALSAAEIVIDFRGVSSISRSFAHEYVSRRAASGKAITETNVPVWVEKMFRVVQQPKKETPFTQLQDVRMLAA